MDGRLRNMTALYLTDGDRMLLLYRVGSRVIEPSWVGVGGHFEKDELNDARAALLREVREEIGLNEDDLVGLRLRYIALRNKNGEIRQNYYFFAQLAEGVPLTDCDEGCLEWVRLDELLNRPMPFTAKCVLRHYLTEGRATDALYCAASAADGARFVPLEEF